MWTLLLARASDPPGTFIDRRTLDSGQIKLGRNARSCDWVLPDDKGHISREHCTISAVGLDLFIVDTSTNGIALNRPDGRIAPQLPVAIRPNDRLLLGEFVITVATEAAGAGIGLVPPPPPPLPEQSSSLGQSDIWFDKPADPIWNSGPRDSEVHDFLGNAMDDFLGFGAGAAAAPSAPDPFARAGGLGEAFSRPIMADLAQPAADFGIPEDWAGLGPSSGSVSAAPAADPFAASPAPIAPMLPDPFGLPASPGPDPFGAAAKSPTADPFGAPAPSPVDPFGAPAPFGGLADPFADFPPLPAAPSPAAAPPALDDDDPFALPGGSFTAPAPSTLPNDPFADLPPAAPAPAPAPAVAAVSPPPARPATSGGDANADGAWAAFLDGAGLTADDVHLAPDAMRRLGVMYRQIVLGLSDIIQDRAAFKDEFRVERTQLSIGRNNPFKHLPPLDTAKVLLGAPLPGFMPADEAVKTAFEDIKKHQLAMLAGVQHALATVFDRLSPAEIEKLMEKAAGAKRGLPFSRGINPWTVYQTIFEALRRDAVSNANGVMSVAFREGYEKFLKSGQ